MFPNNARRRSIMDPTTVFCPNLACPARGQTGQGNIGIHARKDKRFLCTECDKTFSATKGTAFYRRHTAAETGTLVVTVLAHGCPPQAMVAAFGLDERTVLRWLARGGGHGQAVQEQLVEQPRDLGQVQADELRGKQQGGMVWMALAMMVRTRLGLAGEVREHRDMALIRDLMERVRRCALPRPLLVCTDGLRAYVRAVRETFRAPVHAGAQGRPRLRPWRHLCIAQVVKRYAQRCVVDVERRLVEGTPARVETLRRRSQGAGVINTAYIERLHATFRERLASLTRRGRALARHTLTLRHGMYLIATIDNFCTPHESLRDAHPAVGVAGVARTPAMAAGITNHCWTVQELLSLHVPPSRWTPPKQRGRPSRALKRLVERWCS
jgi:transposase-like protein/IS1 family transposase